MSQYISFKPQDTVVNGPIRFSITKAAYQAMENGGLNPTLLLRQLSASKVILITNARQQGKYEVHTSNGTYSCTKAQDGTALLITYYKKSDLKAQNDALKNGVGFRGFSSVIIQIKLTSHGLYFDISNGTVYQNNIHKDVSVAAALSTIVTTMAAAAASRGEEQLAPEESGGYQPQRGLVRLLDTAEQYSVLSSELEEKRALELGKIVYTSIQAAQYDRIDRVAYQFGVDKIDESIFKVGAQVEIEDRSAEIHNGEIIQLVKEDEDSPATALVLLFNEHIDIGAFYQNGWFSVSFSTVNRDVQLKANEKIRTATAAARYMDVIFGQHRGGGFEQKKLTDVMKKLQEKKYPPNESQLKAIAAGINSRDVFLVMGPPGTGKTTVILEWVKYFVTQEHKRVLVSSQNNKAVDNVLARIAEEPDIDIIRIGSESKLQSEVVPYMFENKVKVLRDTIAQNSKQRLADIEGLQGEWQAFAVVVKRHGNLCAQEAAAAKAFTAAARQNVIPQYQALVKLLEEYHQHVQKRHTSVTKLRGLAGKLSAYEKMPRGVFRWLKFIGYYINRFRMTSLIADYDRTIARQKSIATQYQGLRNRYQHSYEQLRDGAFPRLHAARQAVQQNQQGIVEQMPNSKGDIWGFFQEASRLSGGGSSQTDALIGAIDEGLVKLSQLAPVLDQWREDIVSRQNYALNEIVLESVNLVGATCIGINSQRRFANLDFDVTIIDEAGQIQVHNALVPMSVSNKLIMLGDHKQIPPSADQELITLCQENGIDHQLLEKSLFEQMYHDLPPENKLMLDTQYRMPAEIADTISEWFYQGAYYSPPFKQGLPSQIPALFSAPYVIIDTAQEGNRFEKKIEGAGSSNELEAKIISDLIAYLNKEPDRDLGEIGVISAYKSQVKLIKNKVSRFLPQEVVREMVATLDSYQGQERDIILYSFTKSSKSSPYARRIGFLNELRRLNVAMTRCKKMLVLVGDMSFLGGCQHCDKTEAGEMIYDKSEKQFSDFINKMVADVKSGPGEFLSYEEFMRRVKGGAH